MKQAFPAGRVFNVTLKRPKLTRRKGMSPAALLTHAHRRSEKSHHALGLIRLLRAASQAGGIRSPARRHPHHFRGQRFSDIVKQRPEGQYVRRAHSGAEKRRSFAHPAVMRWGKAARETSYFVSPERRWRPDASGAFSMCLSSQVEKGRASRKRLSPPPLRDPRRVGKSCMGCRAARHAILSLAHAAIPAFTRQSRRAGLNGNADPFPSGGASQWRRHAFATRRASRHARATNFPQWRNIAAASFRQLAGRVSLGDDEIKIVAHRVAGHGLPHAMRTRRAPRPGVARLRTPEVTSASGQPSQRCAKTRDGGARRDHRGTSSQGRAPSSHDDRGTRRNALSGVMIKRAFRPLWRDRIERASGNYEQISSQGPLVGALPSGQTETGHGNRPENSALGHVTSSYLRLRQKRRAEHDVGRGEGDRTCGRPHGASLARSVIPLSMPAGRQTIFEGLKSDPDIYASAAVTSSRCNDALDAEGALWRYLLQNAPQFAMAPPRQDSATRQAVERDQGRMVTRRDGWPDDNRANPVIPGGTDIFTSSFSPETLLAGQANIGLM